MVLNRSKLLDYYYEKLYPELESLETERRILLRRLIGVWTGLVLLGGYIFWLARDSAEFQWWLIAGLAGAGYTLTAWMTKDYRRRFKKKIFAKLVERIDPTLRYDPDRKISSVLFDASGLFPRDYTLYQGNDLIEGAIGDTPISFCDLNVQKEYRDAKGRKNRSIVFAGTFVVTEFHKHFNGFVRVVPDFAERYFGVTGRWLQGWDKEVVRMDSPRFEKLFKVYAKDSVEAHYLLTPNIMERIVALQERADAPIYLSFRYEKLFIAVAHGEDRFEPTLFTSLLKVDTFLKYAENLDLILSIVEELNLNRKVWSKE